MKKPFECNDRPHNTVADRPSEPTVRELIDKMSEEDTKLLIDILSGQKKARMVSTLETKALLEKLVKGKE